VTAEEAVDCLVEILATRTEFSEDQLYAAMGEAGVPEASADRAYKFTQIAWGRIFLGGLGVTFAPDYLCFNGRGEVIEAGLLSEQPYFVAAMAAGKRHPPPAGLPQFALMSADVQAVNSALKAGSKLEDLVAAPAALFMEVPGEIGIEKARRVLAQRMTGPAKKPWWRFW
jgi:hypothetical protein